MILLSLPRHLTTVWERSWHSYNSIRKYQARGLMSSKTYLFAHLTCPRIIHNCYPRSKALNIKPCPSSTWVSPFWRENPLFEGIISSVRNKLKHWSTKFFFVRGKIILIQHVLNTILFYILQVLKPSKEMIMHLNKLFNGFIWHHQESRRIHWSSWH